MCWLSGFEIVTLRPPMALPLHHNIVAKFRYSWIASSFVPPNFYCSYSWLGDVPVAWECSILIDKRHSSTFCHRISCHSSNSPKKGAATQQTPCRRTEIWSGSGSRFVPHHLCHTPSSDLEEEASFSVIRSQICVGSNCLLCGMAIQCSIHDSTNEGWLEGQHEPWAPG